LVAFLAYLLVSFLYFGLPVAGHPGRIVVEAPPTRTSSFGRSPGGRMRFFMV